MNLTSKFKVSLLKEENDLDVTRIKLENLLVLLENKRISIQNSLAHYIVKPEFRELAKSRLERTEEHIKEIRNLLQALQDISVFEPDEIIQLKNKCYFALKMQ